MKFGKLLTSLIALAATSAAFGVPAPFVLKWNSSIATPGRQGLVTLAPGTAVRLEAGRTNEVFEMLGVPVPETEAAHRAVSLEFRFRFLQGTDELADGTIHTDRHGVFTPAHHPVKPWDHYKPASQELFSTENFTVPDGADSLELERVAVDILHGKKKVGERATFALVGKDRAVLVASGDNRGDTKSAPQPFLLGAPITAGKPLRVVFDEYRAMNAWVRTEVSKMFGNGIIATYAGTDIRSMTCVNKIPNVVYYSAWADMPLFEITTRIRFDQGDWQDLPVRKLYPAWGSGVVQDLFHFPFDTVPGIFRAADPYSPNNTATIFPAKAAPLPPLHLQDITVPADAKTLSVQTWIHGYLITHYGKYFEGTPYVGDDCTKLYADRQRVELMDLMDSPDFTPKTAWTFPVN